MSAHLTHVLRHNLHVGNPFVSLAEVGRMTLTNDLDKAKRFTRDDAESMTKKHSVTSYPVLGVIGTRKFSRGEK